MHVARSWGSSGPWLSITLVTAVTVSSGLRLRELSGLRLFGREYLPSLADSWPSLDICQRRCLTVLKLLPSASATSVGVMGSPERARTSTTSARLFDIRYPSASPASV